ncbi:hypothetical protein QTG54_014564 [Skeletonema marinoi]|uniref:Calmodulin n=1 Tax=Skeletonema marinoi TaxID=267567 RepID=A0AAD8XVL8_9STRA|nr:hypothetical protein QTG54_014564 [Skeletonema marinoi]
MMRHRQHRNNMCSSGAMSTALRWCLLATAALYATKPVTVSAEDADIFFTREETEAISAQCENLDYVTGPLYASDADGNGVLSQDEFVVFTDLVSGGWLSDMGVADSFQDMPLVLQEANVVLTCLCELYSTEPWGQPGCCDNTATSGIRTNGSGPDEKPDTVQLEYLTYVCGTMSETLGRLNAKLVAPPSSAPSDHPSASPSMKPTMTPTVQPSLSPVTAGPTASPSDSPTTSSPTGSPTSLSPTGSPTSLSPTGSPSTLTPTLTPTSSPVTSSPTMAPIASPTMAPIDPGSPTKTPTATPSVSSSEAPSTIPSVAPTLSTAPTAAPSVTASSEPSASFPQRLVRIPLPFNFVQYLDGEVTAESIMEGETNQEEGMLVKEATNATVTDVKDIQCTPGLPGGNVTTEDECLAWDANILLEMINEADPNERANEIRQIMLSRLAAGWLDDEENFNQEEALKPPTDGNGEVKELNQNPLSVGGMVGIALASLVLVLLVALFAVNRAGRREDATEERNSVKDSDTLANDLILGAYLLHGQKDSSGGSALGKLPDESEDESFYDPSVGGDEEGGYIDPTVNESSQNASYLAAMGAASTLVASTSRKTPRSSPTEDSSFFSPDSTASSAAALGSSPASAGSGGGSGTTSAGGSSGEGISSGAVAGIGGAKDENDDEDYIGEIEPMENETPMTSNSQMDELDVAIEAGDWGHVGALAAVLAAEGRRTPPQGLKSPRSITSGDGASSRSRGTSTNQSMDQARAAEIDKLVEAGDWQGVVLLQPDSRRIRQWMANLTPPHQPPDLRGGQVPDEVLQVERNEALEQQIIRVTEPGRGRSLVRRVVPEEADNVDEMLNQFKGREEELVETLRRMQERAIASRARLAVQKSVKLEAKARARSASVKTIASQGSTAQKISDQNEGGLSVEDKERLRQKISQSPAMNNQAFSTESVNLDELIEKGDWSGVIAAAKAASEGASASNAGNISKEEQDALAQASMWQEIANQVSKMEDPILQVPEMQQMGNFTKSECSEYSCWGDAKSNDQRYCR